MIPKSDEAGRSPSPSSPASFDSETVIATSNSLSTLQKYSDSFSEIQDDESYFTDPDYGYYYDPELCTHLGPQQDPEKYHYEEIYKQQIRQLRKIPHLQKQIRHLEDKLKQGGHTENCDDASGDSSPTKRKRGSNPIPNPNPNPANLALLPFNYLVSNKINFVILLSGVYLFVSSYFCFPPDSRISSSSASASASASASSSPHTNLSTSHPVVDIIIS